MTSVMEQRDDAQDDWDFGIRFDAPGGPPRGDETIADAPVDDRPIRKGGGPPGRSAFLPGGRLRRLSRDRGPAPAPQREPVAPAFRAVGEDRPVEPAFRPIEDLVDPPPTDDSFDPFEPFEPFAFEEEVRAPADEPTPTTTARDPQREPSRSERANGPRSFPGGRAKLPRLHPTQDDPQVDFVSTAFIPGREAEESEAPRTGFHGYNTYESLFEEHSIAAPLTPPTDDDAYEVLGVQPDDEWRTIVKAHRRLVKANHPDRLTDAPLAVRQAAEERLRQINLAYREVKERRRLEGEGEDDAAGDPTDTETA